MATAVVSAEDVALELVATKVAFLGLVETLIGTSPVDPTEASSAWAYRSPVDLGLEGDDRMIQLIGDRAEAIEKEMLRGIVAFLTAKALRRDSDDAR